MSFVYKAWCLINVKTFLRLYSDIVSLLAQKKGEPREENPLRLIKVELLEFTRHIGLEGCGDVAYKMICEIREFVKGGSGINQWTRDPEELCFQGGICDKLDRMDAESSVSSS